MYLAMRMPALKRAKLVRYLRILTLWKVPDHVVELSTEPNLISIVRFLEATFSLYMKSPIPAFEIWRVRNGLATVRREAVKVADSNEYSAYPVFRINLCWFRFIVDPSSLMISYSRLESYGKIAWTATNLDSQSHTSDWTGTEIKKVVAE